MTKKENKELFAAIQSNDRGTVARILEKCPSDIDVYGISNSFCRDKTPLMFCMQCGHFELARWLLEKGANVDMRMGGGPKKSVISLAAEFGHPMSPFFGEFVELTRELIRRGANPTEALPSAVFFYRNWGDAPERMIRLLLENGANPDVQNGEMTLRSRVERSRERYPAAVLGLFGVDDSSRAV